MKRTLPVVLGGLAVATAVYVMLGVRVSPPKQGTADTLAKSDQLIARQPADRDQNQVLASMRANRHVAQEQPSQAPGEAELKRAKLQEIDWKEQHAAAVRRQAALFEKAFERETTDASWSREYEERVKTFFGKQTGNTLESLQCRSTLCRTVVRHKDTTARQEFSESLGSEPFTGGSFYYQATEGTLGSVAYLGRPGMTFRVPKESVQQGSAGKGKDEL